MPLEGRPVAREWVIPDSSDRLVFLEPQLRRHDENLVRVTSEGKVVWRAVLPETGDFWVDCRFEGGVIYANSWSCYLVRVALDTGEILSKIVTK